MGYHIEMRRKNDTITSTNPMHVTQRAQTDVENGSCREGYNFFFPVTCCLFDCRAMWTHCAILSERTGCLVGVRTQAMTLIMRQKTRHHTRMWVAQHQIPWEQNLLNMCLAPRLCQASLSSKALQVWNSALLTLLVFHFQNIYRVVYLTSYSNRKHVFYI